MGLEQSIVDRKSIREVQSLSRHRKLRCERSWLLGPERFMQVVSGVKGGPICTEKS